MEMLIFMALMFGMLYMLFIRPQRRRQNDHRMLIEDLQKGDKVITAGGIYGDIESVDDQSLILTIEDGSKLKILRTSIMGLQQQPE